MEVADALTQTTELVTGMVAQLTPDHREMKTPCIKWNVHDLLNHMVGGAHMTATVLEGGEFNPDPEADHLPEGPVNGWAGAVAAMTAAATSENLAAIRNAPFGEVPGAVMLSVIVSDHITHAWDLAQATGISLDMNDELAGFAQQTWDMVIQPEFRNGDAFADEQDCPDGATGIDKVAAFTGRSLS